jgi:hypothetical protein
MFPAREIVLFSSISKQVMLIMESGSPVFLFIWKKTAADPETQFIKFLLRKTY